MFGHKHDSHNDEDIQIVDLDVSDASDRADEEVWHPRSWERHLSVAPLLDIEHVNDHDDRQIHLPERDVKQQRIMPSSLTPRFTKRQRYVQVILTTSVVLLVLFVLLFQNVSARSKVLSMIAPLTQKAVPVKSNYL